MSKDFKSLTYLVDDNFADTLRWLALHQDCYDSFHYDVLKQELWVEHANGSDIIRIGHYLNANYGILLTS
ncbi:hypothetical protein [Acinetobacter pullicarnis]|uniref:hypothetical protein n=1 Tax=Acinetobacter pullicarnis TaxID=2576829 RepID=UPI00111F4120|nr:hypothetical protein [Acinetobacter pullicarnis]